MLNVKRYELVKVWEKVADAYGNGFEIKPIYFEQQNGENIEYEILGLIEEKNYKASRIRNIVLNQNTSINFSALYNNNKQIVSKIQKYVNKKPDLFMRYLPGDYYVFKESDKKLLYKKCDESGNYWKKRI